NGRGQLGDGKRTTQPAPQVVPNMAAPLAITGGGGHTCALLGDHTASCWGQNDDGELGDGTYAHRGVPGAVLGLANVLQIDAGHNHTCAVLMDGTVGCWGL